MARASLQVPHPVAHLLSRGRNDDAGGGGLWYSHAGGAACLDVLRSGRVEFCVAQGAVARACGENTTRAAVHGHLLALPTTFGATRRLFRRRLFRCCCSCRLLEPPAQTRPAQTSPDQTSETRKRWHSANSAHGLYGNISES